MDQILTKPDVAEWLQTEKKTVSYLVHTKQIPYIRLGKRQVRFSKKALEEWLESRTNVDVKYDK